MAIFKCKMCGGSLEVQPGATVAECEYCGSRQTLPKQDDEKKLKLFDRANRLRFNCEFDKAGQVYESIVAEFPEEAEAYWGNILCKYGIEYVDDPAGDKVPTCHRSSFDCVLNDPDFEMVMENADAVSRGLYREQAKQIEEIRKGIIEVSGREQPYDIFICYKETDENGGRTVDSVLAQDVYDALTGKGYRVFFSRITLEDKLGTEYEPYIFAALNSAKVMLAFGTSYDYYNAVWVKNEWSRYLKLMAADKSKHLIPCYKDIDAYDMPKEFGRLQAQDMGKVGAVQDLLRGIDKLIGKQEQAQPVREEKPQDGGNVASYLKRVELFLEDGNWKSADEYCEKVLDVDPENAEAYLGKLMAARRIGTVSQLKNGTTPLDTANDYKKILRYGDENLKKEVEDANACIKQRNEEARLNRLYEEANAAFAKASSSEDYHKAGELFGGIKNWKDSAEKEKECAAKAKEIEEAEQERERIEKEARLERERQHREQVEHTADCMAVTLTNEMPRDRLKRLEDRKNALQKLIPELPSLLESLADWKKKKMDCESEKWKLTKKRAECGLFAVKEKRAIDEKIAEAEGKIAAIEREKSLVKNRVMGFSSAEKAEEELRSITALAEMQKKGIEETNLEPQALSTDEFTKALLNQEIVQQFKVKYPELSEKAVQKIFYKGAYLTLGSYPQGYNGELKPVEWQVLDVRDGKSLLISKYALDCKAYHEKVVDITWEKCTLRSWLNGEFLNRCFSSEEQASIMTSSVPANKNPKYYTDPGNATKDKVFLLSIPEAEKYFKSDEDRKCVPSAYAKAQGGSQDGQATCYWWLRSPCEDQRCAAGVYFDGAVNYCGYYVNIAFSAVRPALWVKIS